MVLSSCRKYKESHGVKSHLIERLIVRPWASGLSSEDSFLLIEEEERSAKVRATSCFRISAVAKLSFPANHDNDSHRMSVFDLCSPLNETVLLSPSRGGQVIGMAVLGNLNLVEDFVEENLRSLLPLTSRLRKNARACRLSGFDIALI